MSKLKYGVGSIVVAALIVGGLPYVVKNSIDSIIEKRQTELSSKGMDLKVVSHEGYFESTREINIKFTDSVKVLDYISELTNLDIGTLNSLTNNGLIFSDISFKGIVKNSNLFSQTIKTQISIDQLPLDVQQSMANDKTLDDFIKSLLLSIDFNEDGEVSYISLNDLIIKDEDVEVKLLKPELNIEGDIYNTTIKNITFNINQDYENMLIYIDDIKDTLHYTDEFNFEEEANIAKLQFNYKNQYSRADVEYKSTNNNIKTSSNIEDQQFNMTLGYDMSDVFLRAQSTDTNIEKFAFNIELNEIKESPLRVLNDALTDEYRFSQLLVPQVQELVNDGFKINIGSKINNIQNVNVAAKEIAIDLKINLLKNTLNQYSRMDNILGYVRADGQISLDDETVQKIAQSVPIGKYNTTSKNGISYFDIKFKDSTLFINNMRVQ